MFEHITIGQVLDGEIRTTIRDPGQFEVLWTDAEMSAGVYVPIDQGLLLAENSEFEPMRLSNQLRLIYGEDEVPYETNGEQVLVDFGRRKYITQEIHFDEGQIQGLVYAVGAMQNGGILETQDYQEFIENSAREMLSTKDKLWRDLSEKAVMCYANLGIIASAEVLSNVKTVKEQE